MNFKNTFILFFIIILFFICPVNAQITNGDFETGDWTGWEWITGRSGTMMTPPNSSWGMGNYCVRSSEWFQLYQSGINFSGIDAIEFDYYSTTAGTVNFGYRVAYSTAAHHIIYSGTYTDRGVLSHAIIDVSGFSGVANFYYWGGANTAGGYTYVDNLELIDETPASWIQFENTPYKEYDNAIVNFSMLQIMQDYPDKRIFLEIATPKVTEPYYNYVAYELEDYTGYRGLEITGKSPVWDAYHNCSAYIRAYDQDMGNYDTLLEIETSVLSDNHTLINYTGYDYPTNKSYITGQNIGLLVDIMDYIETDFLGYPDELFTVWVKGFSNSNQGNTEQSFDLDAIYWDADRYFIKHIECAPFSIIDSDFNATVECYVSVYRNGNTTQLSPTIYTNMYTSSYIPEGEEGYNPPDIPEEPEDPDIGENETLPENPDIPDIPIVTNESINTSWVYYYYEGVNNSFDTLLAPVYNFTGYTLTPIYLLNDSISDYNYIMNESFTETTQKINILSGSFNIIYNSFHPKIVSLITYYLIWLVLLIILKKR